METVEFIGIEDDGTDLVLSFALKDGNEAFNIKSLILQRSPKFEALLPEAAKGVNISMENDDFYENKLLEFSIKGASIEIKSELTDYALDISKIEENHIEAALNLLKKMNFDNKFEITS